MVESHGELPLEIWADLLEESGEATEALRAWIAAGLGSGSGSGSSYGSSYGYGDGSGYGYGYEEDE